jgi:hypothetical protein
MQTADERITRLLAGAALLWLAIAAAVSATGVLESLPRPALQAILFGLTAALLLIAWRIAPVRAWVMSLPLRSIVLLHVTRFVGFYFLWLHARGRLPYDFAVPGGWGDIAVAGMALAVSALPQEAPATRRSILLWNILGTLDILLVVATAARLGLRDPDSMVELTRLPLSLLPTFLVPLIIASHVIIFVRLRQASRQPGS